MKTSVWSPGAVKQNANVVSNSSDNPLFFHLKFSSLNFMSCKLIQLIFQNLLHFFWSKLEFVQSSSSSNNNNNSTSGKTTTTTTIRVVNFVTFVFFAGQASSEKRLLWLWIKAAMKQNHECKKSWDFWYFCYYMVLCIALCWCCQWILTVGGNLLLCIVTPLHVITVAWCCRQTQDVLHPAEWQQQLCKHQSVSGQQVSSVSDIALDVPAVYLLQISAFNILRLSVFAVDQI